MNIAHVQLKRIFLLPSITIEADCHFYNHDLKQ
jgi:hypothetical protein